MGGESLTCNVSSMGMAQIALVRQYDRYMIKNYLVAEIQWVRNVRAFNL